MEGECGIKFVILEYENKYMFMLIIKYVYKLAHLSHFIESNNHIHQSQNTDVVITTPSAFGRWSHNIISFLIFWDLVKICIFGPSLSIQKKAMTKPTKTHTYDICNLWLGQIGGLKMKLVWRQEN